MTLDEKGLTKKQKEVFDSLPHRLRFKLTKLGLIEHNELIPGSVLLNTRLEEEKSATREIPFEGERSEWVTAKIYTKSKYIYEVRDEKRRGYPLDDEIQSHVYLTIFPPLTEVHKETISALESKKY